MLWFQRAKISLDGVMQFVYSTTTLRIAKAKDAHYSKAQVPHNTRLLEKMLLYVQMNNLMRG